MPRPTSKAQLLQQTIKNYDVLQAELAKLSPAEMIEFGIVGDWSVKDVLAHLFAWQQMVVSWYRMGKRGEKFITPSEKYTWTQIPALNQEIYETYRDHSLNDIQQKLSASHQETLALIETLTDDELFTPKTYSWTKSTTLGSYFTSATCSHYDWAYKEIRRGFKTKKKA
ncbi:MAG: ClbS/DfsB family four-helix bundle protein [bacterium]|nr:ClbS/DfsB family four-helix bundle protein [bacterium]